MAEGGKGHGSSPSAVPRVRCQRAGHFLHICTLSYRELWVLTLAQLVAPSSLCCEVHLFKVSQCLSLTGGGEDGQKGEEVWNLGKSWLGSGWRII